MSAKKKRSARKSRPPGGRRLTMALAAARAKARGPEYDARFLADLDARVGKAPLEDVAQLGDWLARALAFACESALRDPGLPVEARREQLSRLAPQLSRALGPAELAQDLRDFARALAQGKRHQLGQAGGHA